MSDKIDIDAARAMRSVLTAERMQNRKADLICKQRAWQQGQRKRQGYWVRRGKVDQCPKCGHVDDHGPLPF